MCLPLLHENELLNIVYISSHPFTLASACGLPLSSTKSLLNAGRRGCSFNSSIQQTWEKDKVSNSVFSPPEHGRAVGCESTHRLGFNLANSSAWGTNHKESLQSCNSILMFLMCGVLGLVFF